jgi:hypothetical protein
VKILSALLLVLALAAPAFAAPLSPVQLTSAEAAQISYDLGCPADVTVTEQSDQLNGVFIRPGYYGGPWGGYEVDKPTIMVFNGQGLDQDAARAILLHEIGHCRQWQKGELNGPTPWVEWGADTYSIDFAAQLGLDPSALDRDLYDWHVTQGHKDSGGPHGDPAGRLLHMQYELTKRGYGTQGA